MINHPKELFDAFASLRLTAWKEWENKAHYEWKITLTLWAGLLAIGVAKSQNLLDSLPRVVGATMIIIAGAVILVAHFMFLGFLNSRMNVYRSEMRFWELKMQSLLPSTVRQDALTPSERAKTSRTIQVMISATLYFLLIAAALHDSTPPNRPTPGGGHSCPSLTNDKLHSEITSIIMAAGDSVVARVSQREPTPWYKLLLLFALSTGCILTGIAIWHGRPKVAIVTLASGISIFAYAARSLAIDINLPDLSIKPQITIELGSGASGYTTIALPDLFPFEQGVDTIPNLNEYAPWTAIRMKVDSLCSADTLLSFFVVGNADHVPLKPYLQRKFGSNTGLASARANWVARRLFNETLLRNFKERVIVTTCGPAAFGDSVPSESLAADRSVRLFAIVATK